MQTKTVSINVEDAKKAYSAGDAETKNTLALLMPSVLGSVKSRLTSYEAACDIVGIQPKTLDDFKKLYEDETDAQYYYSHHRITTGIKAINEGRVHDWDKAIGKFYPYWDMETYGNSVPGSGFSLDDVDYAYTLTGVGARLSMHEREDAKLIADLFKEDYRVIMKK